MKFRIYSPEGDELAIIEADSGDAALLAFAIDQGYQAGDMQREVDCEQARRDIDDAKATFAARRGMEGHRNSAITKAWKKAGSPTA